MAKVEIYTWSTCPFCHRAKQLLDQRGIHYTEYVLDGDEAARDEMVARGTKGRRSMPQIFINDQHIGGSDDLHALERQGLLDELLNRVEVAARSLCALPLTTPVMDKMSQFASAISERVSWIANKT